MTTPAMQQRAMRRPLRTLRALLGMAEEEAVDDEKTDPEIKTIRTDEEERDAVEEWT